MLHAILGDLHEHYYDTTFGGVDIDADFRAADAKIDSAATMGQILSIVAQPVIDLGDVGTFFFPPPHAARVDYGWRMAAVGDSCYIVQVRLGSDAEAKGVHPGDLISSVNGIPVDRNTIGIVRYLFQVLHPQPALRLVISPPGLKPRAVIAEATITERRVTYDFTSESGIQEYLQDIRKNSSPQRREFRTVDDSVLIWRPGYLAGAGAEYDDLIRLADEKGSLILDLRGSSGGVLAMLDLLGHFTEEDRTLALVMRRKSVDTLRIKGRGKKAFQGKLVVLVDASTWGVAEIATRFLQLDQRGAVVGDRTMGAVHASEYFSHSSGVNRAITFGETVSVGAIFLMSGEQLDRTGVTPDELVLPTASDLAEHRDPALARALAILGHPLTPEAAGKLFPPQW